MLDLLRVAVAAGLSPGRALAEVGRRHPGRSPRELRPRGARGRARRAARRRARRASSAAAPAAGDRAAHRRAAPRRPPRRAARAGARAPRPPRRARAPRARHTERAARAAPQVQLVVALLLVPSVLLLVAAALIPAVAVTAWRPDRDPADDDTTTPRPARRPTSARSTRASVRDPQPVGRRVGQGARGARLQGARQHQLRLRVHARPPRRRVDARRGGRARPHARRRRRACRSRSTWRTATGPPPRTPRAAITLRRRGRRGRRLDRGLRPRAARSTPRARGRARSPPRARPPGGSDFPFTLTARAENHIRGNPDLDDTIARLHAYERAGADVLYAPGLRNGDEIRAVCRGDLEAGQRARPQAPVDAARSPRPAARASASAARWPGWRSPRWRARRRRSATPAASPRSTRSCRSRSGSRQQPTYHREISRLSTGVARLPTRNARRGSCSRTASPSPARQPSLPPPPPHSPPTPTAPRPRRRR